MATEFTVRRPTGAARLPLLLAFLVGSMAACATSPVAIETTPFYKDYHPALSSNETHRGEACSVKLFGIVPLGGDGSAAAATEQMMQRSGANKLAYMTLDVQTTFYFLVTQECTIATGVFVDPSHIIAPGAAPWRSSGGSRPTPAPRPRTTRPAATRAPEPSDSRPTEPPTDGGVVELGSADTARTAGERLSAWIGRRVSVETLAGEVVHGELRGFRNDSVIVRLDSGDYWQRHALEVRSVSPAD